MAAWGGWSVRGFFFFDTIHMIQKSKCPNLHAITPNRGCPIQGRMCLVEDMYRGARKMRRIHSNFTVSGSPSMCLGAP